MLGAQADIEDLTQDTLLVVVRRIDQIRDPAALRSFVYSVAVRVARNDLRRRAVRRCIPWA
jgi:RNA polymerase sigma-70 factor (ECF subfamily)